jgi:hypothetical protein
VNNTGTKYVRIVKKLRFEEKKKKRIYNVENIQYLYFVE